MTTIAYEKPLLHSDGIGTKSIPVEVKTGSGTFKASLRLRVQCGIEADIDLIGLGAGAVVGIYANIVEFVTVLDSTPNCALVCLPSALFSSLTPGNVIKKIPLTRHLYAKL